MEKQLDFHRHCPFCQFGVLVEVEELPATFFHPVRYVSECTQTCGAKFTRNQFSWKLKLIKKGHHCIDVN